MLSPRLRDLALTVHVLASVGWFGAVAVFFVLAIAGATSHDPGVAASAYVTMQLTCWWMIVPLCFAALATGLLQSLGTKWGLFRHYWVVIKLVLTVVATALLLLHARLIDTLGDVARTAATALDDHRAIRVQLVLDAGAALAVLVAATALAVYKPRGMTRYGRRKEAAIAGRDA